MNKSQASKGNILLVLDESENAATLTGMLLQGGYRVRSVAPGQIASETARTPSVDLIMLGLELSSVDSYRICSRIKANEKSRDLPVIFVIDSAGPHDIARLFAMGGADYVTGPFRTEEVLGRIDTHLALASMKRQLAEKEIQLELQVSARLHAEEELRGAETSGRSLVENLSEVIYTADAQGLLTYISPAIEPFLGYLPSEVIGRHVNEFLHPEDLALASERFQRVLSGHVTATEYRALTKSGEMRWMRTSSQPVIIGDSVIGTQGVLTDITERKVAEEQIRHHNEFLTSVLESLTHPFYVINANDYTIEIANSATHWGNRLDTATCYALTHNRNTPCDTTDHPCPIEELKKTGKPVTIEHIHYDPDGNPRYVEVHAYPLFDNEGNLARAIEYTLDITERKQAEQALRESEETWRSLTEYSPDHIMLLDREANIRFINHALPGLSREQVVGTSFYEYALEEYRQPTRECFERVLRTGQSDQFESVYVDENGIRTVFESHVGPVMRDGTVWGLTVRNTDITERKQAEEALQILTHELEERVKELNCLYGISKLAGRQNVTLDEILQGTAELVPPSFQHPEVTCARIILGEKEFRTPQFRRTIWSLDTALLVHGSRVGSLEVCYLEERPAADEGPFLREERLLIDAVAERLGRIAERIHFAQALQESEARWRSVTENSPDHVILLDTDLNIQFVNYASPGLTVGELIGTPLYTYVEEARQAEIKQILEKVLKTAEPDSYETEYRTPEGDVVYYESRVVPRRLEDQLIGLAVNARDVTERVQAEQALRQSERKYRQLLETLQEGIWVIDKDAFTTFVNPRMAEMLGYTVDEMMGKHLYSFMDERGVEITKRNLARREQGIREQHDFEFLRKDGSRLYALLETSPIYDDDGNYAGGIAGIQDITERRRAEEAQERSEALLKETQQMARVGGWELDLSTSKVTWTDEVYRIHEVPPDFEPTLENALQFYAPEDRPILEEAIQQAAETGIPWDLELRFVTAAGNRLWVRAIGKAEHLDDKVVRLSGTFQDITERKLAEEALQEAATAAERNRLARDLHDSVTQALFSASLVAEVLPQVWQRDPAAAQEGVEELRLLTRGALAEMRTMLLELRPTALVETRLNDLLRQLTEAITSRAQLLATCDVEASPTLPPNVHVTFYRVAQEALHNVVKHAEAKRVTVALHACPAVSTQQAGNWQGQMLLQIRDDGRGLDPSRIGPDCLGLGIMRERAETIGATLDIESWPGRGTQVTLVWPGE